MADLPTGSPAYVDARRRYRLDSRIATGGMGEVWRATDTVLDRLVAVKLLRREHADDPVFRSRFETEAQHAAGLRHPGVAQVYDFSAGEAADGDHPPYLVMEFVDGKPLSAILRPGQPMDPAAAARLVAETADALGAAHAQGIVHRDVKPANILVTDDRQVKITDFGIARAADAVALTRTGEVLGTPQYISPEQAQGLPATPASDVYSLGAVAYECLVGQRPFVADTPVATALAHLRQPVPELPSTVPAGLASVVRRALAKAPEERYPDGAAFAAAVREADAAPAATRVLPAPVAGATADPVPFEPVPAVGDPGGGPADGAGARVEAGAAATWAARARGVPMPVWAAVGVLVVVVAIAALASVTTGADDSSPGDTGGSRPASHHTVGTGPSSPVTRRVTSPTSPSLSPPTQTGKGPGHGKDHGKGNGHEHGKGHE
jgi:eukaryotic-like serine/threonine-protein kinase